MKILEHELVFEQNLEANHMMCHASHILPEMNGEHLIVFFGGTAEKANDVRIWSIRRNKAGVWEQLQPVSEDDGIAHWNPVLMRKLDQRIALFYKVGKEIDDWQTMVRFSQDDGQSFGQAQELVTGDQGGRGPVRNKVVRLSNGILAAPASLEKDYWRSFVDFSTDDGETWNSGPEIVFSQKAKLPHRGVIQPTLWESKPGKLHVLMRSSESEIYRSDSDDYGKNWSIPYGTGLPNNNSGIDIVKLADGRLVLLYNPIAKNWGPRSPISLAISCDNGHKWEKIANLETAPGEYSYPAAIAIGQDIFITYTWRRLNLAYWHLQF